MKFRPCIDLHNGKVKQIVGGSLDDSGAKENFVSDKGAAYYAEMYRRDGLTGGHVIMLGPGNEDEAMAALKAYPGGLQIGGGISPDNAARYLDAGASHVIVTSYVFKNGLFSQDNLEKMIKAAGRERLVIDLSCRIKENSYYVVTERWQNFTGFEITRENIAMLEGCCDEFLVHAVDVEGMKEGVDTRLISLLSDYVSIPVTYAGGVRDFGDIEIVFSAGKGRIDLTIGSALDIFGGSLPYSEVLKRDEFRG
ncbi:MAG: phosphoribosylformimino-5-aminoimidazole carboxamide ribotide isomerase [Spirochaetae bacterium HGW-Spirochaetae-5]|nr:MAG: phosphoribosylformimino-5-aminoimidazole carboxamide ribotide isomerase [Spirochaetae bacterium HGW-Spirochaetae-5]